MAHSITHRHTQSIKHNTPVKTNSETKKLRNYMYRKKEQEKRKQEATSKIL